MSAESQTDKVILPSNPDKTSEGSMDSDLIAAKEALSEQAEGMLSLLSAFEAKLNTRLDLAEQRINALRARYSEGRANSLLGQEFTRDIPDISKIDEDLPNT